MFRTWADVLAERAQQQGAQTMVFAAGSHPSTPIVPGIPVDRWAGEGPPPCCRQRRVAADMLVWYGGLPVDVLARVRSRIRLLADVPVEDLYLCDGCRAVLARERVLSPEEMPRSRPIPEAGQ